MERESMEFDVVIVGAGPAGLATACRLMQISQDSGKEITVCVVEKGSEVGAHILSGAVFEPKVLDELFSDWREKDAPVKTAVTHDEIYLLSSATDGRVMPNTFVPKPCTTTAILLLVSVIYPAGLLIAPKNSVSKYSPALPPVNCYLMPITALKVF